MKGLIILCLAVFLIADVYALRINEVEMNPAEGGSGKEWVELYNEDSEEVNITNWEIWEGISGTSGPKKIKNFSEEIILNEGEFYIIEFSNKLNNGGDFVILYDSSHNKIDETIELDEIESSSYTYQFCEGEWKFISFTKGSENNCTIIEEEPEEAEQPAENQTSEEENNQTSEEENNAEEENSDEEYNNYTSKYAKINTSPEVIELNKENSKSIKSEDNKEILKRNLAFAGIVTFCVTFGGALFLLNIRKRKNEFT